MNNCSFEDLKWEIILSFSLILCWSKCWNYFQSMIMPRRIDEIEIIEIIGELLILNRWIHRQNCSLIFRLTYVIFKSSKNVHSIFDETCWMSISRTGNQLTRDGNNRPLTSFFDERMKEERRDQDYLPGSKEKRRLQAPEWSFLPPQR